MIKKLKFLLAAAGTAALAIASPAAGQENSSSVEAKLAEEKEFFEKFAKAFEKGDQTPIDPAQLALAKTTVASLIPEGSYRQIFDSMVGDILTPIMEQTKGMDAETLVIATGLYDEDFDDLTEDKRAEATAILDPAFEQRSKVVLEAMNPVFEKVAARMEPAIREGLARAYARKFTAEELREVNAFFATPIGKNFATKSFALQVDPEVMQATMGSMGGLFEDIMSSVPDIEKMTKALPPQRNLADLSDGEMAKLADILGVSLASLKEARETEQLVKEYGAGDAAEASSGETDAFADETGDEAWYSEDSWTAENREKVSGLSTQYDEISEKSSAVYESYEEAFNAAVAEARARLKNKAEK